MSESRTIPESKEMSLWVAEACDDYVKAQALYKQSSGQKYTERFIRWAKTDFPDNERKQYLENPDDFLKIIFGMAPLFKLHGADSFVRLAEKIDLFDVFKKIILKELKEVKPFTDPIDPSKTHPELLKSQTPFELHLAYRNLLESVLNEKPQLLSSQGPSKAPPKIGLVLNTDAPKGAPRFCDVLSHILQDACNKEVSQYAKHNPKKYFELLKRSITLDMLLYDRYRNDFGTLADKTHDNQVIKDCVKSSTAIKATIKAINEATTPQAVKDLYNNDYVNFFTNLLAKTANIGGYSQNSSAYFNQFGILHPDKSHPANNDINRINYQLGELISIYPKKTNTKDESVSTGALSLFGSSEKSSAEKLPEAKPELNRSDSPSRPIG